MSTSEKGRPPSVYPLLSGAYVPPCLKTWHGCSLSFTSAIPAFYADNSFQKTTKLQQKLTDARLALIKKHLIAKARVERVKVQQEQQAVARSLRAQQRRFERELRASSTARHNAATKIQKVVRGWLCRRDTERRLIASERERALKEVQSLEDFAHWWYLTSEREIAQRAQVIQRAFRRYRRLKMLAVVAKAYAILLEREQCALSLTVSCVYRQFLAARRFRLERVLLTRDANLQRIRRKLACLRIAGCWRRLGMSVKLLRMRIRRFVRRLRARRKGGRTGMRRVSMECDSPGAPLSSYTSPKGEAFLSLDSDAGEAYNRSSMYSSMRSSSPEDRGKIAIGAKMNALGFHQPKDLPLCPLLRRLESPAATPESVFSRLLATTECANQRSSTSHSHRTAFSHRRTATATPTALQLSRFSAGTPVSSTKARPTSQSRRRYMDATESFAAAMESRAEEEEVSYKRRLAGESAHTTLPSRVDAWRKHWRGRGLHWEHVSALPLASEGERFRPNGLLGAEAACEVADGDCAATLATILRDFRPGAHPLARQLHLPSAPLPACWPQTAKQREPAQGRDLPARGSAGQCACLPQPDSCALQRGTNAGGRATRRVLKGDKLQ